MNREDKARWLIERGYVKPVDGDVLLSSQAVALLSGTSANEWKSFANQNGTDVAKLPAAFVKKARRGAKEVQAAAGTDDILDVLYAKAVE